MPNNFSEDTLLRMADMRFGLRVDRASAAVVIGPTNYFQIIGRNYLIGFYGEIVTAQAIAQVVYVNMDVTAGTDTLLAAGVTDASGFVAGRMCYLPAVGGNLAWTGQGGACPLNVAPSYLLRPGYITVGSDGSQTTGRMKWALWYLPTEPEARVVAV